jgi:dUTP pyrophosphatase
MKPQIQRLNKEVIKPTRSTKLSAGWDIYTHEDFSVLSSEIKLFATGFKLALPKANVALLRGRSGLAMQGIDALEFYQPDSHPHILLGGVIDSDYRGEVGVILKNLSGMAKHFKKGDRVCQMLILLTNDEELEDVENLDSTERGEKGFGSSDVLKKGVSPQIVSKVTDPSKYIK